MGNLRLKGNYAEVRNVLQQPNFILQGITIHYDGQNFIGRSDVTSTNYTLTQVILYKQRIDSTNYIECTNSNNYRHRQSHYFVVVCCSRYQMAIDLKENSIAKITIEYDVANILRGRNNVQQKQMNQNCRGTIGDVVRYCSERRYGDFSWNGNDCKVISRKIMNYFTYQQVQYLRQSILQQISHVFNKIILFKQSFSIPQKYNQKPKSIQISNTQLINQLRCPRNQYKKEIFSYSNQFLEKVLSTFLTYILTRLLDIKSANWTCRLVPQPLINANFMITMHTCKPRNLLLPKDFLADHALIPFSTRTISYNISS